MRRVLLVLAVLSLVLHVLAWLAARVPEACETDGPADALCKHGAALWRTW